MTKRYSLPAGCPKHSPWGAVDHGVRYAEGVFFVSTPSHGGFMLEAKHNVLIPAAFAVKAVGTRRITRSGTLMTSSARSPPYSVSTP